MGDGCKAAGAMSQGQGLVSGKEDRAGIARELGGGAEMNWPFKLCSESFDLLPLFIKRGG